jgi:S-formylglutathione hydrolase FrmB
MKKIILLIILTLVIFSACNNHKEKKTIENEIITKKQETVKIPHKNDTILSYKYDCCFIANIKGAILLLHGWNLPADEWCEKTSFCEKALNQNYVLIIPDYSKSNYTLEIYPQTIANYKKYPTITWIMETQIFMIQETMNLLLPGQNTFVAGISTGGRGATLLAYYMPNIFKAVASLSGDFDITTMTDEYIYYSFLGYYNDFPERWKKECFAYDCENFKVPIYIAHGDADRVSPVEQSKAMYDSIKLHQPNLKIKANFPTAAGHNYDFWEYETDNILEFFDEVYQELPK